MEMATRPTSLSARRRSQDWEAGTRVKAGPVNVQWSIYDMNLINEIHFRYAPDFVVSNTNLDPTHRYGHETIASGRRPTRAIQGELFLYPRGLP